MSTSYNFLLDEYFICYEWAIFYTNLFTSISINKIQFKNQFFFRFVQDKKKLYYDIIHGGQSKGFVYKLVVSQKKKKKNVINFNRFLYFN